MEVEIREEWKNLLQDELDKPYFIKLMEFIKSEYNSKTIFPPQHLIFNAFDAIAPNEIKVVILGQDPYHGMHQAHGLSFSVQPQVKIPKSLINIYKEIEQDTGNKQPTHGNLERWANQGVFLLNAVLTVVSGEPLSHLNSGWLTFTDKVIETISQQCNHVVFMLWGNFAKKKTDLIDSQKHLVLQAAHPSPLSAHRGFFGCNHFSKANQYLISNGKEPIKW